MGLHLQNEAYCWDLRRVERLNSEPLVQVMALEGSQDHPIKISDSLAPILIPAPGGNLLVEIDDGIDNEAAQVITEDQVEAGGRRVTIEEGGVDRKSTV